MAVAEEEEKECGVAVVEADGVFSPVREQENEPGEDAIFATLKSCVLLSHISVLTIP